VQVDLLHILSLIDLTSLNDTDDAVTIAALCKKAVQPNGHVAAVCIYPRFVKQAVTLLANTPVKVATVANFPRGSDAQNQVLDAIHQSIEEGAEEMDVVFPYLSYLSGDKERPYDFIRACKAVCGESRLLKVILETGMLRDLSVIAEVSYHLCHAGADFLKTSTGKTAIGATVDAVQVMLTTIQKVSRPIGLKVSGGVRTIGQAKQYRELASQIMGEGWVTPAHFRIGASQLLDQLILSGSQYDK